MLWHKTQGAGFGAAVSTAIEDVFSTYLYTGNGSTQTITNGIDLAGEGGLVWGKVRTSGSGNEHHYLYDTLRGVGAALFSNLQSAQSVAPVGVTSFNSNGFGVTATRLNDSNFPYASWTFRKAPRFFDVVTFVATSSSNQRVSHNLGVTPGAIFVKATSASESWKVYDKELGRNSLLYLNQTNAAVTATDAWGTSDPTDTDFGVNSSLILTPGYSYVAYLFAHDPLGPSGDGSDGLIACGSYTGNNSTNGPEINLGWEPQWVLLKSSSETGDWFLFDNMRGISSGGTDEILYPNASVASSNAYNVIDLQQNGFKLTYAGSPVNGSGQTYIYIAIRRGPMREPTVGTEVFAALTYSGNGAVNRPIGNLNATDTVLATSRNTVDAIYPNIQSKLQGKAVRLITSSTDTEYDSTGFCYSFGNVQSGVTVSGSDMNGSGKDYVHYQFRRAPGFFDVVAYTGTGVARTISHNLNVAPEMMIVKGRTNLQNWPVYAAPLGNSTVAFLNLNNAVFTGIGHWNSTTPTSSVFSLGDSVSVNQSGVNFIAYLFASLPGISKVGSYTGNGSSQTISCGFTGGARFVLIKRTNSTGDWYVWDTARGIVAGNDPHLSLNTTAAEVTTDDSIDPDSSGFIVNQDAATNINVSSASYIFYAVS